MSFFDNATLSKVVTSSFQALIPKHQHPQFLAEQISLITSLHKIISKLMVPRIKGVSSLVISEFQMLFLLSKTIFYGIIVTNELVDWAYRLDQSFFMFKVDFEKAYNSINWQFLDYMLQRLGFGIKWRRWVKAIVCTSHIFVLVNDNLIVEFKPHKGLKQGTLWLPSYFLWSWRATQGCLEVRWTKGQTLV